jgi:uncharacterized OsmC-like protein
MNTTNTASTPSKPQPQPLNGVDTPTLFATIGAVADAPALAQFQFRANNQWMSGTHSRTTMGDFTGAGGTHQHKRTYAFDGDHPAVLCGTDNGPTPVEFLLHALATCLTAGIGNIAAARGVRLESVESTIEGNIDLQGILGLSDEVRNGYEDLKISFKIRGDAPPEKLRAIVEQSRARSAVYDVLRNGVPVSVEVDAG